MPGFTKNDDRYIIPRWRSFRDTVRSRELESSESTDSKSHSEFSDDYLLGRLADWEIHRTTGHASDLVGAAVALGRRKVAVGAAQYLLDHDLEVSRWARELALDVIGHADPEVNDRNRSPAQVIETAKAHVRSFRRMLRQEPNDPITWIELARNYATLGHKGHARKSIHAGLQLAKNNRFVLRAATRFLLHDENAEMAHRILLEAESTPTDPWLIATEIAVGSICKRRPRLVKAARQMIADRNFSEHQITELASAMATLELKSGSFNKSKKLFRRSLRKPTENSMAQAVWAAHKHNVLNISTEFEHVSNSYEAQTLHSILEGSWSHCVYPCRQWHYYQPFSRRPCIQGSFVAATALGDYPGGMEFAEMGLKANPNDFLLLNNYAFSAAQNGMVDQAEKVLEKVPKLPPSSTDSAVFKATKGLVRFRMGKIARGRELYYEARSDIRSLRDEDRSRLYALATTFHAIEELRSNSGDGERICAEALRALRLVNDPIGSTLRERLKAIHMDYRKNV